jgi:Fur family ferric uptake transcriptional regulator
MENTSDDYIVLLKKTGLKSTRHRLSILEILNESPQPISAEEIFLHLKSKEISINLSSVYRILDTFVEKELAVKSSVDGCDMSLFEASHAEHLHHFICQGCRKMVLISGCPLESYEKLLQDKLGCEITGHKLEIYGYCKDCMKKSQ